MTEQKSAAKKISAAQAVESGINLSIGLARRLQKVRDLNVRLQKKHDALEKKCNAALILLARMADELKLYKGVMSQAQLKAIAKQQAAGKQQIIKFGQAEKTEKAEKAEKKATPEKSKKQSHRSPDD